MFKEGFAVGVKEAGMYLLDNNGIGYPKKTRAEEIVRDIEEGPNKKTLKTRSIVKGSIIGFGGGVLGLPGTAVGGYIGHKTNFEGKKLDQHRKILARRMKNMTRQQKIDYIKDNGDDGWFYKKLR